MHAAYATSGLTDRGGRRTGTDRRTVSISGYGFERRSGKDRRMGMERRSGKGDFVNIFEPKRKTDEYVEFLGSIGGLFQGICFGALLWEIIIITIVVIRIS
jgi:hypothetical protein